MSKIRRTISLLLVLCMIGALLPYAAFANMENGSSCVHVMDEDGSCRNCGSILVAVNGRGCYFSSLQDAIDASGNIRLLRDIIPDGNSAVTICSGNSVTLNLDGKRLGGEADGSLLSINNYGSFSLVDGIDNTGELHGSIYTKGFEIKDSETGEVIESAYGASTVISGGIVFGDITAEHDENCGYYASELKPNPSVIINGGCFIGGHVTLPDDARGAICINDGRFSVEPPRKLIRSGFEAEYDGKYYCIVAARFYAGLIETLLVAPDLSERAKYVATSNKAVTGFITDDLLDVSEVMRQNAVVFDESTSLKSALYMNAVSAEVFGEGDDAIVTGMSFSVSPILYVCHGGGNMQLVGDWDTITTENSDGGVTVRFPVDSRLSCGKVSFSTCSRTVDLDVLSQNGDKFIQIFISGYELDSGVSYSAVIKEECTVTYNGCGGVCDADEAKLESETITVSGKDDIVLKDSIFKRDHYSFTGWNYNGVLYQPGDVYPFVIGDMTFDAIWAPEHYSIVYVLNGGDNSGDIISGYDYNTSFILSEPEREGAVFAGWYDNPEFAGETVDSITSSDHGDKTFYAKWNIEIQINISGNGSGIVSNSSEIFENGSILVFPENSDLSLDFFADAENGSYIDAVKINGEKTSTAGHLETKNMTRSMTIEVIFGLISVPDEQISDYSAIAGMRRVVDTFGSGAANAFAETGIGAAIDISAYKQASLEIEENDTVSCSLNLIYKDVYYRADESIITGFVFDAEPVVTLISKYGIMKASDPVSENLVNAPVRIRIPVDSNAYLRYAAVYCGEEFIGYFRTEDENGFRFVDIVTEKLKDIAVMLVDGRTNDPVCAIGSKGFVSIEDALAHAGTGDIIYVFSRDCGIPVPGEIGGVKICDAFEKKADLSLTQESVEAGLAVEEDSLPDEEIYVEKSGYAMLSPGPTKTDKSVAKLIHDGTSTYYDSFAEAFQASADGDTLVLLQSIKVSSSNPNVTYRIKQTLTIDLDGNKIVCENSALTVFTVNDGVEFNLRNGEIEAAGTAVKLETGSILNLYDTCTVTGLLDTAEGTLNNIIAAIRKVDFDPKGGTFPKFVGYIYAEVDSFLDEPEEPVNGSLSLIGWYKDPECTEEWNFAADTVPDSDMTLYAKWDQYVAYLIKENGAKYYYKSLKEAYDAAEERETIGLLSSTVENVIFCKELLFDLNGYSYVNSSGVVFTDDLNVFSDSNHSILTYLESGRTKYQVRRQYKITYHMGTSQSATEENNPKNSDTSYFDKAVTLYNPTKTRIGASRVEKATFAGWYYDPEWKKPTVEHEVSMTNVESIPGRLPKVAPPSWPKDVDLYPRWMWTISSYCNNYGYIMCDGVRIVSGTRYFFDEEKTPKYTFHPYDGYYVYRATIRDYRLVKEGNKYNYVPSYWDKHEGDEDYRDYGLQINTTIVVTFARGYYNPMTGDDSNIRIWICLMCASLVMLSGAAVVSRRRKKR